MTLTCENKYSEKTGPTPLPLQYIAQGLTWDRTRVLWLKFGFVFVSSSRKYQNSTSVSIRHATSRSYKIYHLPVILQFSCFFSGTTAQPRPRPPHSWGFWTTHSDTPQSVLPLWIRGHPDAKTSTWKYTTIKTQRPPWHSRDLNPQYQKAICCRPSP